MRICWVLLLLTLTGWAQPRVEELPEAESDRVAKAFAAQAFAGHDCVSLAHVYRLVRVDGAIHGLALHQVNLHSGNCSWIHYVQKGNSWKQIGVGLPDPAAGDQNIVIPQTTTESIRSHFKDLVRCLGLKKWSLAAQKRLLDPDKFYDANS
ncbi:hypothetical protein ABS71_03045 [bacterium SCN 62-11]|nr:hypothetical protein [Candidatus Eremiobacteraeota bacterium]ODT76744.1 MAG: hypothetical protein ABS71_03045 [bacterium SCN 62-11]